MNNLERATLTTIAYHNSLSLALSSTEIYKFLANITPTQFCLGEIRLALKDLTAKKTINESNGFFCLKNEKTLINQRLKNQKVTIKKWEKLNKLAWIIASLPYIKTSFVTGSIASDNARNNSDLDILVITNKNRFWTARAILTIVFTVLGQRRHDTYIKDRLCHSALVTDGQLINRDSFSFAQDIIKAIPFNISSPNSMKLFYDNSWLNKYLSNYRQLNAITHNQHTYKPARILIIIKRFFESFLNNSLGDVLEKWSMDYQVNRIKKGILPNERLTINQRCLVATPFSYDLEKLNLFKKTIKKILGEQDLDGVDKLWMTALDA
ncbi:MAG: hypothetical protein COU81_04060 [Candidatus Portnoybacteria bacterium CG10_big_fil_rev_8_21_14_0_10_36_7]|uniref:Polymerase nucleotidyl transferase domain-containing protein n=1 Tax=Candidatus Portnoybacteria bacterium CG10_big_fil_rev_8_21_14_0_10_36_7 TaxID=1974812 RepID=A0A2M8KD33_9BACT|nr:MAG: hypothetical protein COU81_04060 [Candidatus Portnoybacteria bacterium CG10_big_fil_rev_8_21_14_0_10_36_7]